LTHVTSFPYLRATPAAVSASPWQDDLGAEVFPEGSFRTWDPNTDIRARRDIVIHVAQLRKDCHLGPKARIRVQATWYSSASAVRGASLALGHFDTHESAGDNASGTLEMLVKGHVLSANIELRTQIVVLDADSRDKLAPTRPGSVVWSDSREILLEGCGARFPLELVTLPADEQYAGWLLVVSDDFDWPFLGGVRLYINTENEVVRAAITATESDTRSALVRSAIYHDIGRQMIAKALSSEDFRRNYDRSAVSTYLKGSVGHALWSLLKTFLPGQTAADLNQMRVASPAKFESMLQHKFRLFGSRDA
jgi:hypothetical protein